MLDAVRDRARPYFADAPPAHGWHHVQRVEAESGQSGIVFDG